jgi:plastocyanin
VRRSIVLAVTVAALAFAPAALGDERVIAAPLSSGYVNPEVSIDPGEKLTFLNPDLAPHDVTSAEPGLFASETVGAGSETPVVGADSLPSGSYDFICSIHPYMTGRLTVGGGGGGGHDGHDMKAPKVSVKVATRKISDALDAGAIVLKVKVSEAAKVRVTAESGKTKVAKGKAKLGDGRSRIAAKLTGAGKRALRGAGKLKLDLTVHAQDAAGNAGEHSAKATLR